jgi:hypothetical protein
MNAYGTAAINVVSGNHKITAPITFQTSTDVNVSGSNKLTLQATSGSTYQNVGGITKKGTGTLLLTGADWAGFGPTTIEAGVLQFAADNSAGLSNVSDVTIGPNGTLDMNSSVAGSVNDTFNTLAGPGLVINHGNLTLQMVGAGGPTDFSGKFTLNATPFATRTFTKNGPRTQIFSGALEAGGTFTTATVAGGTLLMNNPSGSLTTSAGVLTVNSGTTLGGNGYIDGPVTVASGPGTLAPGSGGIGSIGTLHLTTTGNLTFSGSSTVAAVIAIDLKTTIANGDESDLIDAPMATVTVSNSGLAFKPRININNAGTMTGGTYTLMNYGTLTAANFGFLETGFVSATKPSGFLYKLVNDTTNKKVLLDVQFTGDFINDNIVDSCD